MSIQNGILSTPFEPISRIDDYDDSYHDSYSSSIKEERDNSNVDHIAWDNVDDEDDYNNNLNELVPSLDFCDYNVIAEANEYADRFNDIIYIQSDTKYGITIGDLTICLTTDLNVFEVRRKRFEHSFHKLLSNVLVIAKDIYDMSGDNLSSVTSINLDSMYSSKLDCHHNIDQKESIVRERSIEKTNNNAELYNKLPEFIHDNYFIMIYNLAVYFNRNFHNVCHQCGNTTGLNKLNICDNAICNLNISIDTSCKKDMETEASLNPKFIELIKRSSIATMADPWIIYNKIRRGGHDVIHPEFGVCIKVTYPECEAVRFDELDATYGSITAYHGSKLASWCNIMKYGFVVLSGTSLQANGAAYGNGIYLTPQSQTARNYSRDSYFAVCTIFKKEYAEPKPHHVINDPSLIRIDYIVNS